MILTSAGFRLIETIEDLPVIPDSIDEIFIDIESTSFNDKEEAFHPFKGHRVCGVAFSWTGASTVWYMPVRHRDYKNIDLEIYKDYFRRALGRSREWVNHNVNFDALFFFVDGIMVNPLLRHRNTIVYAQLVDSDRMSHGLKQLARDWLGLEMTEETHLKSLLRSMKTKDYGRIPFDLLGPYACQDVAATMLLWDFLKKKRDAERESNPLVDELWETECLLTPVLYDMEVEGIQIDKRATVEAGTESLSRMIDITTEVYQLTKIELSASNDILYKILCVHCGLPVLKWNVDEEGVRTTASFDKEAMKLYQKHPSVVYDETNKKIVDLIREYRKVTQFTNLFVKSFLSLSDENNKVHPIYNQVVRTGRMSCSDPNIQQQNADSKELIVPEKGMCFGCWDASQVEFRLIVDYCDIDEAIAAYIKDPRTDYHQYVADVVRTQRQPAKTINFAMAYGMGKDKTVKTLETNPEVMAEILLVIDKEITDGTFPESLRSIRYRQLCELRAVEIYDIYHRRFPEIFSTSYMATQRCKTRGWIQNKFGRRRMLGTQGAHKAFNSLIQGCAMDFIKTRMVALAPRYNDKIRKAGLKLRANVHDELVFSGTKEAILDMEPYITQTLSEHNKSFRVPLVWDFGYSEISWADAKPGKKKENEVAVVQT